MIPANEIAQLALASVSFFVCVVTLAVMISLFVRALSDLGIRASLQREWTKGWLETRASLDKKMSDANLGALVALSEIEEKTVRGSIFSLPTAQFCGQVSALAQSRFNESRRTSLLRLLQFDPSGEAQTPSDQRQAPALSTYQPGFDQIERSVDDLQMFLEGRWRRFDYTFGVVLAMVFVGLSVRWTQSVERSTLPISLYATVSVTSALIVPQVRPIVDRFLRRTNV